MKVINGVPIIVMSVSDECGWVAYEHGYIEYGRFDEADVWGERLSHWVDWTVEPYPTTEEALLDVLSRVLTSLSVKLEEL